jgi:hypothetical protein
MEEILPLGLPNHLVHDSATQLELSSQYENCHILKNIRYTKIRN